MKAFFHFWGVLSGYERPETQVTTSERALLVKAAKMAHSIVEIGCFEGSTTATLAASTAGIVYSVDVFHSGRIGICYGEWIARIHLAREGIRNARLIKGPSYQVAKSFTPNVDLLFIDGDHSYEGIRRDWVDWFPKVAVGGLIALHDCKLAVNSPVRLGTMQFYEQDLQRISNVEEIDTVDSLVLLRRVS